MIREHINSRGKNIISYFGEGIKNFLRSLRENFGIFLVGEIFFFKGGGGGLGERDNIFSSGIDVFPNNI